MRTENRAYILRSVLCAVVYAASIFVGLLLVPTDGSGASLVWPVSAMGLGILFLWGEDLWPALLLTFFIVLLSRGLTPPVAAAVALGNVLESVIGALLLKRFGFHPMLSRLQDALVFALASFVPTLASASVISVALHFINGAAFDSQLWLGLWLGHTVSILSFGAFVLRWLYKPNFTRSRQEWVEGIIIFGAFTLLTTLEFWTTYSAIGSISLLYVSIIPLIWIALRTGPRGITLANFLLATLATTGILFGHPALNANTTTSQILFGIQLVVGTLSLIFLLFTSIVEERKEATKALHTSVSDLEQALEKIRAEDQAKADFIAILAHELRNPLSPILSSLEIMKQNGIKPENEGLVSSMASNVHVMARLLDDLLDMSRISQKKFRIQREPVKLSNVIAHSLEMAAPYIDERSHTLTVSEPEEDLWVDGDPVRLAQILVNLLTNAAKYTPPGGRIRMEARREGNHAVIEVTDNGLGIDPSRLRKIFEPFGASDTTAPRAQGLHIGLSLAKRMVELHNGSLVARSEGQGRGSSFRVTIPLMPQAPLLSDTQSLAGKRRSRFSKAAFGQSKTLGELTILIVDDNEAAAQSLARLLEHNGHKTLIAYDAPEALKLIEEHTPQVGLLDIGLPSMDGYELCARLRERLGSDIMLVALTGYGQQDDKQKARAAGFNEHLTKPVSIVDVERVLVELSRL